MLTVHIIKSHHVYTTKLTYKNYKCTRTKFLTYNKNYHIYTKTGQIEIYLIFCVVNKSQKWTKIHHSELINYVNTLYYIYSGVQVMFKFFLYTKEFCSVILASIQKQIFTGCNKFVLIIFLILIWSRHLSINLIEIWSLLVSNS